MTDRPPLPAAADLFGDIVEREAAQGPSAVRAHLPGLVVTALAAMAAAYLSDHYGAPLTLMALLVGLALNFLNADARLAPGLTFASRTLLRLGIVLVGAKVTFGQMADLGPVALLCLVVIVAATLASGALLGRLLGFGTAFGTLVGGAVAICGASAALAVSAVLGEKRVNNAQLALVLVGISAMSSLAMFLYPIIAHGLGLSDRAAGFVIGASIHDVAQALGAGYAFSNEAGETAAIVKLTRVAMLAPALMVIALFLTREPGEKLATGGVPWFVIGFFALAGVNSAGWLPQAAVDLATPGAAALLALAVTATGIRSPMQALLKSGPKPLLMIAGSTLVALGLAILAAMTLI
jgi:uncharacterized integral membrane protein (TIGR00698 family)